MTELRWSEAEAIVRLEVSKWVRAKRIEAFHRASAIDEGDIAELADEIVSQLYGVTIVGDGAAS